MNVLFGTVRYPNTVRLRYRYDTVAELFRYCAVNVQVQYQSGGGSVQFGKLFGVGSLNTRHRAARKSNLILGTNLYMYIEYCTGVHVHFPHC